MNVPIVPKENPAKIAVMSSRWHMQKTSQGGSQLVKTYSFREVQQRNAFVRGLTSYEESIGHFGKLSIDKESVSISVWTDGIDSVSEIDKEYAAFSDSLYKEVTRAVYNSSHEEEKQPSTTAALADGHDDERGTDGDLELVDI